MQQSYEKFNVYNYHHIVKYMSCVYRFSLRQMILDYSCQVIKNRGLDVSGADVFVIRTPIADNVLYLYIVSIKANINNGRY